ncbi:protein BEAN1 [Geospiza fortis]|uniref:Protein BEAN1 n=1 Tax=Geospiza fortis TaxID=48883 RepID=A0A8N5EZL4_GEOFO|nr:protein BEAN1 [Geospiza fortis]
MTDKLRFIFFHLPFISGSSISIGIGGNYSNLPIASNQSSASSAFPSRGEHGGDSSLLVSPLLVGQGSPGEPGRERAGLGMASNNGISAPDGFSHGGSSAELRSTCSEELPPGCDFDSYLDILSQVNIMYPDPPPCYDECVGPGATQIYIPTDDPPPYSLTDPCQRNEIPGNICSRQEEETARAAGRLREPGSALAVISRCGGGSAVRDSGV